jgi:hypothetical protein
MGTRRMGWRRVFRLEKTRREVALQILSGGRRAIRLMAKAVLREFALPIG